MGMRSIPNIRSILACHGTEVSDTWSDRFFFFCICCSVSWNSIKLRCLHNTSMNIWTWRSARNVRKLHNERVHNLFSPTSLFPVAPTSEHRAPVKLFHFSFLILRQSVGLLGRGISPSQGCYLHRTTQTQNKRRHPCMSGIRTHDHSVRASEDGSFLRPRGHSLTHIMILLKEVKLFVFHNDMGMEV
jgi:hypothetical protein